MNEIDPAWRRGADALQAQISTATRRYFEPRGSVTAQIHNAIGRKAVQLCVADIDRAAMKEGVTGRLVLFTEHLVAVVDLSEAPYARARARSDWKISIRTCPRSSLRSVEVVSDHSEGEEVDASQLAHLAWRTRLRLTYANFEPVDLWGPNVVELDPVLEFALADLSAS
jgi:hypothetical protein